MYNPIYPKIDDNIPRYIKEEYPVFRDLVINYFKWLETDENFLYVLTHFSDDIDVNNECEPYINFIKNELCWNYKAKLNVDDRTLIKILRDFYLSRGTERSYKILFKILFDADVKLTYPRDQLFKLSDNNYIVEHEIITTANNFQNNTDLLTSLSNVNILNISITGLTSGLTLIVDKIFPILKQNKTYLKIIVSDTNNDFQPFERVLIYSDQIGSFIEHVFAKLTPKIIYSGYNYKPNDILTITNLNGATCEFIPGAIAVASILSGGISNVGIVNHIENNIKIYDSGINYVTGDTVIIDDLTGEGFIGKVVTTDLKRAEIVLDVINGEIQEILITSPGLGYLTPPKITIIDSRNPTIGYGADFTCDALVKNYVGDTIIEYGGANYIDGQAVVVTISSPGGGGTQATATATISNGSISHITITDPGSNYTSAPTITVIQALNDSARVRAVLMGSIIGVTKISGGRNYHPDYTTIIFGAPESTQSWAITPTHSETYISGKLIPSLIEPGHGYTEIPNFDFHNISGGTNFDIILNLINTGVVISNYTAGENYTVEDSIDVDSPTNIGKIEYVDVINPGHNFIDLSTITLSINSAFGENAELYPYSKTIGRINKFIEKDSYWVFNSEPNTELFFNYSINNNDTVELSIDFNSCINRNKRYFENSNGLLEINAFLHDSYFYQQFAYLLTSEYPSTFNKEIIEDLLHPVGFLKFDLFDYDKSAQLDILDCLDAELERIIDLSYIIDFTATFDEFFATNYFRLSVKDGDEDIFIGYIEQHIVFSINNILDTMYETNGTTNLRLYDDKFNVDLEHLGYHKIQDFDFTQKELVELAALDAEISV